MKQSVLIVLSKAAQAFDVIGEICGRDGIVHDVNYDMGIIEATLGCEHIAAMRLLNGVGYVRPLMSFSPV